MLRPDPTIATTWLNRTIFRKSTDYFGIYARIDEMKRYLEQFIQEDLTHPLMGDPFHFHDLLKVAHGTDKMIFCLFVDVYFAVAEIDTKCVV